MLSFSWCSVAIDKSCCCQRAICWWRRMEFLFMASVMHPPMWLGLPFDVSWIQALHNLTSRLSDEALLVHGSPDASSHQQIQIACQICRKRSGQRMWGQVAGFAVLRIAHMACTSQLHYKVLCFGTRFARVLVILAMAWCIWRSRTQRHVEYFLQQLEL